MKKLPGKRILRLKFDEFDQCLGFHNSLSATSNLSTQIPWDKQNEHEVLLPIDVPDFFSGRGSKRPPRISKFFFRGGPGGPGGKQGVNRILGGGGPLEGRFRGSRGSVLFSLFI